MWGPSMPTWRGRGSFHGESSRAHIICKNHLEFQTGRRLGEWPHLPLTLLPRLSHLGPFCPQATLAAFHPPPAHLPRAPSPGMPTVQRMSTVLSPDCQCFLLPITASPAIIRILCSLFLPSVFPLVCLSMCLSSLSHCPSVTCLLRNTSSQGRKHDAGIWTSDVFSSHKSICKKSCLIGTRSSGVFMALKQDGFSLGNKRLATGRKVWKVCLFSSQSLKREKATVPLFIYDRCPHTHMRTHAQTSFDVTGTHCGRHKIRCVCLL